jgi:hypothetical protein
MLLRNRIDRRSALLASLLPILGAGLGWTARSAHAQGQGGSRRLVAYLSRSGNTRVIAGQLARQYGADLFEIRTAIPYLPIPRTMRKWSNGRSVCGTRR